MTFPTVPTAGANTLLQSNQSTATTTHTFPSLTTLDNAAGDLLLAIIVTYQGSTTNAEFSSWGGGFTEFIDQSANSTTVQSIGAAYKFSDGTETGTFTVTSATSNRSVMFLLSIKNAHDSTVPEATAKANGTGAAADPAALDPANWAAEDTLWIAVAVNGETSLTGSFTGITAAPTNYTGYVDSGIIGGDVIGALEGAVAFRQTNTASENVGGFTVDVGAAGNSALLIAVRPAGATPVAIGLVTETESSQAVSRRWGVNTALAAETEYAQLTPSVWVDAALWADAMAWEHPTIEPRKIVALGQATETESAQPVTLGTGGGQTIPLGLVTETETAQSATTVRTVAAGQPVETETSQAVTARKNVTTGLSAETETSQPVAAPKNLPLGLSAEAETAFTATVRRNVAAGQPVEVESAQPVSTGGQTVVPIGLVTETETSQPVTLSKIVKLDNFFDETYGEFYFSPVEREITQPVTLRRPLPLSLPAEAETAPTLTVLRALNLGLVTETETGQLVSFRWGVNLGQSVETESALNINTGGGQTIDLSLVVESETAQPVTVTVVVIWDPFEPVSSVGFDPFTPDAVPSVDPFEPVSSGSFDPFGPVS